MLTHLPGIIPLPKHYSYLRIAKQILEFAHKVKLDRGDVLRAEDLAEQERLTAQLGMLVKRSAPPAETEPAITALHEVLVRNGGKIYPVSTTGDYVEMVVMAAIVAGAIRSFLLQPFKIPTNSMWPTYNGMTAEVRAPDAPVPDLATRALDKLQWTWTYVERAPVDGEVKIPLENAGFDGKDRHYRPRGRTPGAPPSGGRARGWQGTAGPRALSTRRRARTAFIGAVPWSIDWVSTTRRE